jgi:dCTP deaminase
LATGSHAVEREQTYYRVIGAIALAFVIGLTVAWLKDATGAKPTQSPPTALTRVPAGP